MNFGDHQIPAYMREPLRRWIEDHEPPGGFLQAVLRNDLSSAIAHADGTNRKLLAEYVSFLYNEAPSECHGSPTKVRDWCREASRTRLER